MNVEKNRKNKKLSIDCYEIFILEHWPLRKRIYKSKNLLKQVSFPYSPSLIVCVLFLPKDPSVLAPEKQKTAEIEGGGVRKGVEKN